MDIFHKLTKWIDRYRFTAIGGNVLVVIILTAVGCQSLTPSIHDPTVKVDRLGFNSEVMSLEMDLVGQRSDVEASIAKYNARVDAVNDAATAGFADLDRQDQIRTELFSMAGAVATQAAAGQVTTASIVGTLITAGSLVLGLGAAADGRRKDSVIAKLKTVSNPPT